MGVVWIDVTMSSGLSGGLLSRGVWQLTPVPAR